MFSSLSPRALARSSAAHPKRVIGAWIVVFVVAMAVIAMLLGDVLSPQQSFVNTPESQRAANQIEAITGSADSTIEQVVMQTANGTFADPGPRAQADAITAEITALGPAIVKNVTSPTTSPDLISKDGRTAIIPITMAGSLNDARDNIDKVLDTALAHNGADGLSVHVTGLASIDNGVNKVAEEDLKTGETFGILLARSEERRVGKECRL